MEHKLTKTEVKYGILVIKEKENGIELPSYYQPITIHDVATSKEYSKRMATCVLLLFFYHGGIALEFEDF